MTYDSAMRRSWSDGVGCSVTCFCRIVLAALFVALAVLSGTVNADVLVSSGRTHSVLQYDQATGTFVRAFVSPGDGGLDNPQGLAIGPDGNLYVASFATDSVLRYDGVTGAFLDAFVPNVAGGFGPGALTFGPDGNLYVSDFSAGIVRYDGVTGAFNGVFVPGFLGNTGLLFHSDGKLYVSAFASDEVRRYDGTTGRFIDSFVTSGSGGLDTPSSLSFGPGGDLYVVSQGTSSVLRYDGTTGTFITAFVPPESGGLIGPTDLHFSSDGHLYVAGFDNGVLRYDGATGEFIDTFIPAGSGGLGGATYFLGAFTGGPPSGGDPCSNIAGDWEGSYRETYCDGYSYDGQWTGTISADCRLITYSEGVWFDGSISSGALSATGSDPYCGETAASGTVEPNGVRGTYTYEHGGGGTFSGVFTPSHVSGCTENAKSWVYKSYVGYYARCAEFEGFEYWCARLDSEGDGSDLSSIIAAFGTSQEYNDRFEGLSDDMLINSLYLNMFDRDSEPNGLAFYLGLLDIRRQEWRDSHESDDGATEHALSRIALDVLNGAQGNDLVTLEEKTSACPQY